MTERRARILVVDDEPAMVELMKDFLSEQGFEVVPAHSGVQALAKLAQMASRPSRDSSDMMRT